MGESMGACVRCVRVGSEIKTEDDKKIDRKIVGGTRRQRQSMCMLLHYCIIIIITIVAIIVIIIIIIFIIVSFLWCMLFIFNIYLSAESDSLPPLSRKFLASRTT